MNNIEVIVRLMNKCGDSLNALQHNEACELLVKIDRKMQNVNVPVDIIFYRLKLGAEMAKRIGNYKDAIEDIARHLHIFHDRTDLHFKLLIIAGELESSYNRLNISTKYVTEALGLAENVGDKTMIAEAYYVIGQIFAPKYIGLAFYFFRKAERYFAQSGKMVEAEDIKLERALLSILSFLYNRSPQNDRLQKEANRIVSSLDTSKFNPHQMRRFRYIKSVVTADEDELKSLIDEMQACGALPDVCRYGEIYIGICIEKGLFEKARTMFYIHKKELIQYYGTSEKIIQHLEQLNSIIENKIVSQYVPYKITKNDGKTTILDILDKYALADELWALDDSIMRSFFPSYEQEGYFDAITMPDGSARLYPCGLAFNVYYRGQTEYYKESKPSLYRKNVSNAERFIERIKYEELKRCVEDYPLTDIFRSHVYWYTPDNKQKHIPLAIDHLALAQHYGIKTELMDITADKFVAAFFATTDYNDEEGYTPIVDDRKKPGVFYRCQNLDLPIPTQTKMRFRAVGLQPFSRPGEQAGLVYEMMEGENFNDVVISKELFNHDKDASEFIFNYTNRSMKLFPKSPLETHADAIKNSKVFSTHAYKSAKDEFFPDVNDDLLQSYLQEQGVSISDDVNFSFTQEEKDTCRKEWAEKGDMETFSKIIVRPVYTGGDIPVFGSESRFK